MNSDFKTNDRVQITSFNSFVEGYVITNSSVSSYSKCLIELITPGINGTYIDRCQRTCHKVNYTAKATAKVFVSSNDQLKLLVRDGIPTKEYLDILYPMGSFYIPVFPHDSACDSDYKACIRQVVMPIMSCGKGFEAGKGYLFLNGKYAIKSTKEELLLQLNKIYPVGSSAFFMDANGKGFEHTARVDYEIKEDADGFGPEIGKYVFVKGDYARINKTSSDSVFNTTKIEDRITELEDPYKDRRIALQKMFAGKKNVWLLHKISKSFWSISYPYEIKSEEIEVDLEGNGYVGNEMASKFLYLADVSLYAQLKEPEVKQYDSSLPLNDPIFEKLKQEFPLGTTYYPLNSSGIISDNVAMVSKQVKKVATALYEAGPGYIYVYGTTAKIKQPGIEMSLGKPDEATILEELTKMYPIGTTYKVMDSQGNYTGGIYRSYFLPRKWLHSSDLRFEAGNGYIYANGKYAPIVSNKGEEKPVMYNVESLKYPMAIHIATEEQHKKCSDAITFFNGHGICLSKYYSDQKYYLCNGGGSNKEPYIGLSIKGNPYQNIEFDQIIFPAVEPKDLVELPPASHPMYTNPVEWFSKNIPKKDSLEYNLLVGYLSRTYPIGCTYKSAGGLGFGKTQVATRSVTYVPGIVDSILGLDVGKGFVYLDGKFADLVSVSEIESPSDKTITTLQSSGRVTRISTKDLNSIDPVLKLPRHLIYPGSFRVSDLKAGVLVAIYTEEQFINLGRYCNSNLTNAGSPGVYEIGGGFRKFEWFYDKNVSQCIIPFENLIFDLGSGTGKSLSIALTSMPAYEGDLIFNGIMFNEKLLTPNQCFKPLVPLHIFGKREKKKVSSADLKKYEQKPVIIKRPKPIKSLTIIHNNQKQNE